MKFPWKSLPLKFAISKVSHDTVKVITSHSSKQQSNSEVNILLKPLKFGKNPK